MTIHSYLLEVTTKISVTLDVSQYRSGDLWDAIILKANEQINELDMAGRTFTIKVVSHIDESPFTLEDGGSDPQ